MPSILPATPPSISTTSAPQSPTELRPCQPGEFGVVISRYHKIDGYDWIAIPLIPYLYAVDERREIPVSVDKNQVCGAARRLSPQEPRGLAPDEKHGKAPVGEWTQLVGSSYDRTIHGFEVVSTAEQDERFIAIFNDRRNIGHFNRFFHNCADFSRVVLDIYLPHAIHRNFIADIGLTTPKQVAKSLVKYGQQASRSGNVRLRHPSGARQRAAQPSRGRSGGVAGQEQKVPSADGRPQSRLTGGVVVAYLAEGRMKLPKNAAVFNVDDVETEPEHVLPRPRTPVRRSPLTPAPAAITPANPPSPAQHPRATDAASAARLHPHW